MATTTVAAVWLDVSASKHTTFVSALTASPETNAGGPPLAWHQPGAAESVASGGGGGGVGGDDQVVIVLQKQPTLHAAPWEALPPWYRRNSGGAGSAAGGHHTWRAVVVDPPSASAVVANRHACHTALAAAFAGGPMGGMNVVLPHQVVLSASEVAADPGSVPRAVGLPAVLKPLHAGAPTHVTLVWEERQVGVWAAATAAAAPARRDVDVPVPPPAFTPLPAFSPTSTSMASSWVHVPSRTPSPLQSPTRTGPSPPLGVGDGAAGGDMVVQQFLPHDGVMWKVCVLGGIVAAQQRMSVDVDSYGAAVGAAQGLTAGLSLHHVSKAPPPSHVPRHPPPADAFVAIADVIQRTLGVTLFNFDVVRVDAGTLCVVDVNYFPSLSAIPDRFTAMRAYLNALAAAGKALSRHPCLWLDTATSMQPSAAAIMSTTWEVGDSATEASLFTRLPQSALPPAIPWRGEATTVLACPRYAAAWLGAVMAAVPVDGSLEVPFVARVQPPPPSPMDSATIVTTHALPGATSTLGRASPSETMFRGAQFLPSLPPSHGGGCTDADAGSWLSPAISTALVAAAGLVLVVAVGISIRQRWWTTTRPDQRP